MTEQRDEEQASLDERDRAPEPRVQEADEGDALEQAQPAQPVGDEEPDTIGELPEGDALDQVRDAGAGDEFEERR